MTIGQIVCSKSGSDKNTFLVIIETEDKRLLLCDGKRYKLNRPKRKNPKHVRVLDTVLDLQELKTDKAVRKALAIFRSTNDKEKNLCQKQI